MLDLDEFNRWFSSAKKTLESSKRDKDSGDYSWACFKAQQAAEKAIKALLWGIGKPKVGHMLKRLVDFVVELGFNVEEDVINDCTELSKYYITTRYPDVWGEGVPEEFFTKREAEEAVKKAERIINWVSRTWNQLLEKEKGKD
ncbi:MAG: HEPN domain-containing protein [Candidatus Njordarchaeia archaeon]